MRDTPTEVIERAKKIRLLGLDVDGVLTNGDISLTDSGEQIKSFNVKDGLGIKLLEKSGISICIITARKSEALNVRAKELGLKDVYQGQKNKFSKLTEIMQSKNLSLDQVAYMGDDLPDLSILTRVGLSTCPADAVGPVKTSCDWSSSLNGGNGCVRELCDLILNAQEKLNNILSEFT